MSRRQPRIVYCEMCGRPIFEDEAYTIVIEGARMLVCEACYNRYRSRAREVREELPFRVRASTTTQRSTATRTPAVQPTRPRPLTTARAAPKRPTSKWFRGGVGEKLAERYEVVPDYAERVRRARERLGLTQEELAVRVRESVNVIKRIEAGTLVPTVDLAKRLEKVLGVKLLEPVVEEIGGTEGRRREEFELTLGDIVEIKEE